MTSRSLSLLVLLFGLAACGGSGSDTPFVPEDADGGDLEDIVEEDTRSPFDVPPLDQPPPDTTRVDTTPPDTTPPDTGMGGGGMCVSSCTLSSECEASCWRAGEPRTGSYCCVTSLCIYRPESSCDMVPPPDGGGPDGGGPDGSGPDGSGPDGSGFDASLDGALDGVGG